MGGRAFIIGKDDSGGLKMSVVPRELYDAKVSITNSASAPAATAPRQDSGLNMSAPSVPQP